MHDRLVDMLRPRHSPEMRWSRIRSAWLTQLHGLATAEHHGRLIDDMERIMDARVGADTDLTMLMQDVTLRSLLPLALTGLTSAEAELVRRDLEMKLLRLVSPEPGSTWHHLRFISVQVRSGLVVRRVLRQRASGRRRREADLADPFVAAPQGHRPGRRRVLEGVGEQADHHLAQQGRVAGRGEVLLDVDDQVDARRRLHRGDHVADRDRHVDDLVLGGAAALHPGQGEQ